MFGNFCGRRSWMRLACRKAANAAAWILLTQLLLCAALMGIAIMHPERHPVLVAMVGVSHRVFFRIARCCH